MAYRKNKRRIDPRYFLHETANRDAPVIIEGAGNIPIFNKRLIRRVKWDALEAVSAPLTRLVKGMLRTKEIKEQVVTAMKAVQLSKQGGRPRNPLSPPTPHHRLKNERPTAATGPWSGTDPTWERHQRVWDRKEEKYLQDVKTWTKDKKAYDDHRKGIKAPVLTADDLNKLETDVTRGGADGTGLEWQELKAAIDKIRKVEVKGDDGRTRVEYKDARRIINEALDAHAQLGTTPSQPLGDSKAARVVNPMLLTFLLGISGSLQGGGWAIKPKRLMGYGIVIGLIAWAASNLTGEAQKTANDALQWILGALGFEKDIEDVVESELCTLPSARKQPALEVSKKNPRSTINAVTEDPDFRFCLLSDEFDFVKDMDGEFVLDDDGPYALACPERWAKALKIKEVYAERLGKNRQKQLHPELVERVKEAIRGNLKGPGTDPDWRPQVQLVVTTNPNSRCTLAASAKEQAEAGEEAKGEQRRTQAAAASCKGLNDNPRNCFTAGPQAAYCDHCPEGTECYEIDSVRWPEEVVLAPTWEATYRRDPKDIPGTGRGQKHGRCLTPEEFKRARGLMQEARALREGCAQGPRVKKMKLKLRSTQ